VRLLSRNHVDHAKRLRDIAAATTALPEDEASPYRGAITRSWLKVKVPGWTESEDR
jgi:hypothetical protein